MNELKDIHKNGLTLSAENIIVPALNKSLAQAIKDRDIQVPVAVEEEIDDIKATHAFIKDVVVNVTEGDTASGTATFSEGVLTLNLVTVKGADGTPGANGKSAYEVAVANGYEGTEAEWLESLKAKGLDEDAIDTTALSDSDAKVPSSKLVKAELSKVGTPTDEQVQKAINKAISEGNLSGGNSNISDSSVGDEEEAVSFLNDDESETFAKVTEKGISAKGFYNMDGNEIGATYWKDKTIAWFGTSIPAGATGVNAISTGNSYPIFCGQFLGAKVYNEAVGESAVADTHEDQRYSVYIRRMGASVADLLKRVNSCWQIDDENKTYTDLANTYDATSNPNGYTNIPAVSSYEDVCYQRYFAISQSYQIKLVSRHLLSDDDERIAYLKEVIGSELYDILVSQYPEIKNYYDTDLFVFDHGHNDNTATSPNGFDISNTEMTNFYGAMNTLISLILQYQPHKKIVIVTDFTITDVDTSQINVAEHWQLPVIKGYECVPYGNLVRFKTRGYWSITTGKWVDSGFSWDDTNGVPTDMYLNSAQVGDGTVASIKTKINPTQDANGVWWYETTLKWVWFKDNIHPHTDLSLNALRIYAQALAKKLEEVPNGY